MTPSLIPWGSTGAVSRDTNLRKLCWYLKTLYFIPDNRAKWLVLSAWVTSIIFSVPILFFFDLAETKGNILLNQAGQRVWLYDWLKNTTATIISRIRHSVLDRLQLSVAVAALHEPGVPLHLHHPRPHHRRVLHHHHRNHLEVRGAVLSICLISDVRVFFTFFRRSRVMQPPLVTYAILPRGV